MRPVGWGVAGFGWVARDFAVPAILASGGRVVGVADPAGSARAGALQAGLDAHAELDALLADEAVEAVYVATPNDLHRPIVERAAAAGKAILCEKPMAATLADAEAMAASVRRAGVLYGTAFDQRHHPAHAMMRDAVRDDAVGTVTAVRIVYACWLGPEFSHAGPSGNWRVEHVRAGGGAMMDLAPHGLDLIEFLLGDPLSDVAALTQHRLHDYEVDDGAILVARTSGGVLASLHVAYNHPECLPRRRLEVVGTRGLLVAENTMGQDAGGRLLHHEADGVREMPFEAASPFERQMRAFSACVRGAGLDVFDLERDLRTMRLLARAYESASCR